MAVNDSFFLELGTMTLAYKAHKFLEENDIKSEVGKISSHDRGCLYGLYVKGRARNEVAVLLRSFGFNFK